MAFEFARQSVTPGSWAVIPWGGSGGDLEGLLMAGLNVIAIDVDIRMIEAMTKRVNIIQQRIRNGQSVEETVVKYFSIGQANEKDGEDEQEEDDGEK